MEKSTKTVHWFTMFSDDVQLVPLAKEGFNEARYVDREDAMRYLIHNNEKKIIEKAIKLMDKRGNN